MERCILKAFLLFVGLALYLTNNAQQNSLAFDSLNYENNTNVLFQNINLNRADNLQEVFSSPAIATTKSGINKNRDYWDQTSYTDSQKKINSHAFFSTGFFGTSNGNVPFWMRSMQYGSIPSDGISLSLIGGVFKEYKSENRKSLMDWGAGFEGRLNAGNHSKFILVEAYTKVRLSIFELKVGRFREQIGLVDSTLSSGAFALSGNALGIPKIEAGIPNFWNVPLTNGVIAIKGNIAHGWMGTQRLNINGNTVLIPDKNAYLHQLSAYGRIGKSDWKVKLYGGINHFVTWGLENKMYTDWDLSKYETFKYVVIGKPHGASNIPMSKVGNHLGSIDQAMEWEIGQILMTGYHQFFYDVGALAYLANVEDGLWGIKLINKKTQSANFHWNKFLFEFLYSKSQGGEINSKPRPSGPENYYGNFEYYNGWSYKRENLGTPLFTSKKYLKDGYPTAPRCYFQNNRVIAFHGGVEFEINNWNCKGLLTHSINYGTYLTSRGFRNVGSTIVYNNPPYFPKLNQLSAYLEGCRELKNGFELGIQLAIDQGELLYNSFGCGVSLTKYW